MTAVESGRAFDGRTARRKMISRLSFAITAGVLLCATAHGQAADQYRLKAVFLYNFAKFVEWPLQTFKGSADPIAICVLGKDPFGDSLQQAVNGKAIEGRPVYIREIQDAQHTAGCHILFIAGSERKRVRSTLDAIRGAAVLTVGESEGFASEGGIINFKMDAGHVRLQINLDAAEQARLGISSKLLSLAEIVKGRR